MADDDTDAALLARARKAAIESAAQKLRLIHEAKMLRPAAPAKPGGVPLPNPDAVSRVANDFLRELARFSLNTHESWTKFTNNNFRHIVDALYGGAGAPDVGTTLSLEMHGHPDEVAARRFQLVNPSAARATVSFTQPDILSADGERRLDTRVLFSRFEKDSDVACPDLVLPPNAVGYFKAAFRIPDDTPKGGYRGEATVVVGDKVVGRLRIELTVLGAVRV